MRKSVLPFDSKIPIDSDEWLLSYASSRDIHFAFKVSNVSDKYLPRHSVIKDCLESDVDQFMLQILSIFIDFIQDRAFLVPFFGSSSNS